VETVLLAQELDLTTATSLKELLESGGIAAEIVGEHDTTFPGTPQLGDYGIIVAATDYAEARRLVDELEHGAGQEPPNAR
jgi:hypothetical protein